MKFYAFQVVGLVFLLCVATAIGLPISIMLLFAAGDTPRFGVALLMGIAAAFFLLGKRLAAVMNSADAAMAGKFEVGDA